MNSIRKRILKKSRMVLFILCVLSLFELFPSEVVKAGVYDNAYTFYQTYGNEMSFLAGANNQGEIYYATKAKKDENTGIKYTTLGWKVRIFNQKGVLVETLYYQLGGNHMSSIDVRTQGGYEFCLYRVTLSNIKSRLSQAGLNALCNPNCNIIFDACTTTKLNGVLQGGMTDSGPSWGDVYTTYNGIVNAQNWSSTTRETLKSYYNKSVEGLFYNVTLTKGNGISQVTGSGKYCFGTKINIQAETTDGYHFSGWTGSFSSSSASTSFVLYDSDITLSANAVENNYTIVYKSGMGTGSIPSQSVKYTDCVMVPSEGFFLEGAALAGWTTNDKSSTVRYIKGQQVQVSNLVKGLGLQSSNEAIITLYATWDYGPMIMTDKIYVALEDAQKGKITEAWLSERAEAFDQEDGAIPYGKNERTSFFMQDYLPTDFTEFQGEGWVTETFLAVDSAGNISKKKIKVYIVDTSMYPEGCIFGEVRFISKRYFVDENGNLISEDLGGLDSNSVWRLDEEYRGILKKIFQ